MQSSFQGRQDMSDTGGIVRRGKSDVVVVEISGQLEDKQWNELVEKLKELSRKYPTLKVRVLGGGKKQP
jgi:hypothetical protein